jgi:hypothetical protein
VADDRIVTFNEDARRDIRETVRAYKSGDNSGNGLGGLVGAIGRFVFQIKLGKADADIAKGASGTVSEYRGTTAGSETDTTTNHTVYFRFGAVSSGKWVLYFRFLGHWEGLQAEC